MWYDIYTGGEVLNIEDWKSQIKRGTLEYCVLLLIAQKDSYGYEIMNELSKYSIVATKESTTYPLLRRLEKDNYLCSYWKDTTEGLPARKYYSITPTGREYLRQIDTEWDNLMDAVNSMRGV